MKIYVSNEILIKHPPDKLVTHMENELTFENPDYHNVLKFSPYAYTRVPQFISLMRTVSKGIVIPRGVNLRRAPAILRDAMMAKNFEDQRHSVPAKFPVPRLKLNDEQKELMDAVLKVRKSGKRPTGTLLIVASTSTGKTILQAAVAQELGQRTLVLCKTNLIRSAWQADLTKYYGLQKKEIGLIQQATFRIGAQFTLSSLATLHRRKERWAEIFSYFGTVILDEVHLLPEDGVRAFVQACPCKYILGATATIRKKDEKKRRIVYNYFGEPVKELEAVASETATSLPISDVKEVTTNFMPDDDPRDFDYKEMVDKMIGDDNRNALIAKHVYEDWINRHCVLVTTNRVGHAELLAAELQELGVTDVTVLVGTTSGTKNYNSIMHGLNSGAIKCLIATDQLISVGANLPPIDRLHISIPIGDPDKLKQLLGRIRRKSPKTGKVDAKVCYYIDKHHPYLYRVFKNTALGVFQEMKIGKYERMFMA